MIAKDFPCKTCHHNAIVHFKNISDGQTVCVSCASGDRLNWVEINEDVHDFVGDNLKYMELLDKREQIKNEQ